MVEERNVPAKRHPFKVLLIFVIAFTLQGMSLVIFRADRSSRRPGPVIPKTSWTQTPIMVSQIFTVSTLEDGGPGSLRQAIFDANATPGLDGIRFDFSEPFTLTLFSSLPVITDPVSIEAPGPWFTETGWLTVDGSNVPGDVFTVSDAAGTSIRGLRLVNVPSGYGFLISGGSGGTVVISNTIQNAVGGIQLQNTGQISVTHNTLLDLVDAAVMAEGSTGIWLQENTIRNIGGTGIRLIDGVHDAIIISNTLSNVGLAGIHLVDDVRDAFVISNTITGDGEVGLWGIQLQNTGQVTVTHNTLLDLVDAAVMAEGSTGIWLQENTIRNIGGTGIRLIDGVHDAGIFSNTIAGIPGGVGISATGTPAPTGVVMRSNTFTDTAKPISLGLGANGGFPAPNILQAFQGFTQTLTFSAQSPADPISYTYPLALDLYRVRDGNYVPLGINVLYDAVQFPAPFTYTVDVNGVLTTDQLAVIATTANPSSSEFSPAVVIAPPPDEDDDGVLDDEDQCPGTVIPEATVPSVELGVNHFALVDGDFDFDTTPPEGTGPGRSYTTTDTGGCSCEQIIDALGLGEGHHKFGCSIGVMDSWVAGVGAAAKQGSGADAARMTTAPEAYILEQNYPNPFNPTTSITFQVPAPHHVLLRVFDVLGREVTTLVNKDMEAGVYQVEWDGRNAQGNAVASGLYLYRIEAGGFSREKTMILLR